MGPLSRQLDRQEWNSGWWNLSSRFGDIVNKQCVSHRLVCDCQELWTSLQILIHRGRFIDASAGLTLKPIHQVSEDKV